MSFSCWYSSNPGSRVEIWHGIWISASRVGVEFDRRWLKRTARSTRPPASNKKGRKMSTRGRGIRISWIVVMLAKIVSLWCWNTNARGANLFRCGWCTVCVRIWVAHSWSYLPWSSSTVQCSPCFFSKREIFALHILIVRFSLISDQSLRNMIKIFFLADFDCHFVSAAFLSGDKKKKTLPNKKHSWPTLPFSFFGVPEEGY